MALGYQPEPNDDASETAGSPAAPADSGSEVAPWQADQAKVFAPTNLQPFDSARAPGAPDGCQNVSQPRHTFSPGEVMHTPSMDSPATNRRTTGPIMDGEEASFFG